MKKRLFLILSVGIMLFAGCGNKDNLMADMETEKTETVRDTEETDIAGNTNKPAAVQTGEGKQKSGRPKRKRRKKQKRKRGM